MAAFRHTPLCVAAVFFEQRPVTDDKTVVRGGQSLTHKFQNLEEDVWGSLGVSFSCSVLRSLGVSPGFLANQDNASMEGLEAVLHTSCGSSKAPHPHTVSWGTPWLERTAGELRGRIRASSGWAHSGTCPQELHQDTGEVRLA